MQSGLVSISESEISFKPVVQVAAKEASKVISPPSVAFGEGALI
jgi:hypothetical protein